MGEDMYNEKLDRKTFKHVTVEPWTPAFVSEYKEFDFDETKMDHFDVVNKVRVFLKRGPSNDQPMNRAIFDRSKTSVSEIIWGPFYIYGIDSEGNLCDIDDESLHDYLETFKYPHEFVGTRFGLMIYSVRDVTTRVLEAEVHRNKGKRRKG